ncbi:hypothetical protein RDI58_011063 [Solanum bulbocastanum]|uniref:Uncharacterized protein n=1 Tax=Solanum bulbocastanum TaxID=147425 RepID=A0AAN8YGY5_SOLBU
MDKLLAFMGATVGRCGGAATKDQLLLQ